MIYEVTGPDGSKDLIPLRAITSVGTDPENNHLLIHTKQYNYSFFFGSKALMEDAYEQIKRDMCFTGNITTWSVR